jgi:hypothetical protein
MVGTQDPRSIVQLVDGSMTELPTVRAGRIYPKDPLKSYPPQADDHLGIQNTRSPVRDKAGNYSIHRGLGLLAGGAQRPEAAMYISFRTRPSLRDAAEGWLANPSPVQRWEQKAARRVARELASRAVGAMRAGRQPHNKDTRLRVAKARHRSCPNIPRPCMPCV